MPLDPRSTAPVELLELRVLDGANRFFRVPAVKLEFGAGGPGAADAAASAAGEALRQIRSALQLPPPRLTTRRSADGRRAAIAFPWRRRTLDQAIGEAAARIATGQSSLEHELPALRTVAPGSHPALPSPRFPVVAITGTNGKSTTTRLVAHIAAAAGHRVGMTNSDGIYLGGELVEAGDWTGFGGAGRVLADPGISLAVLETARGGILLRGIGHRANDVSVVTNISADHLGLQGIDTLDELAEVKAAVVRITRRTGWAVLNAQDPRVWGMRRATRARAYPFSLDPHDPAVGQTLAQGGRAAVLRRGWLVLERSGQPSVRLVRASEVPITVGGRARYNIANALAAAAAADALGIAASHIAAGLRSFGRDDSSNPGRLALWERVGVLAIVDFAHNEAGLSALLEVCEALVGSGVRRGALRLAVGTAGDRTDEMLHQIGRLAGARADELVICEKRHYLRGRDLHAMNEILRAGAREAGYPGDVEAYPTELASMEALLSRSAAGDVVAVMTHVERSQITDWLVGAGFARVSPERVTALLARADPQG